MGARLAVIYNLFFTIVFLLAGCAREEKIFTLPSNNNPVIGTSENKPLTSEPKYINVSFYGKGDGLKGRKTASGEIFDPNKYTAAHKSHPFGTKLKITNPNNNKSVEVRINDRGPFVKGRNLDISYAAAKQLGIVGSGVSRLEVEKLD